MTHLLTIQDGIVIIDKLAVSEITNDVVIKGATTSYGTITVKGDLHSRNITTDSLRVKELYADITNFGNWYAKTFDELNGKGMLWSCDQGSTQLIYRTGNRIWTSSNIDIPATSTYMIDAIPVLTAHELGNSITKSNLRKVGALTALSVIGPTTLSGFAYFDETTGRLGLGTSEPNASISVIDNNVEILIGSQQVDNASIGTYSTHDLQLITNNIPRINITRLGEVHIGDENTNSGILRVHGELYADSISYNSKLTRSLSLEFDNYDLGLVWNSNKHLMLLNNPSRVFTTESFDIALGQSYMINNQSVLSSTALGSSVTSSSLETLGTLKELAVSGVVEMSSTSGTTILHANDTKIHIGSAEQSINIAGSLEINQDTSVKLAVNGDISFNNKKFTTGDSIPTSGDYNKGDICWSQNPEVTGYVGWICITSGSPGQWKTFGLLGA